MKIEITYECDCCKKLYSSDDSSFLYTCNDCIDQNCNELVKKAITVTYNEHKYLYKDESGLDNMTGFSSEEDKKTYRLGIEYGFEHALFLISDYFDELDFIEDLIWKYKIKKGEEKK